ncbi:ABC transporter permease [Naasia lichenicola]|uniref:ABC transporter permease subunit n=1 Tax=Naasia lichenicola TaxID=2565933 RepID=A0A4S4FLZ5_9MICO|nr:ABC transporter permease subunit [Naasia lichenicola]THG30932.1 ABC transporter permease subunit [Naasia lichenicola]
MSSLATSTQTQVIAVQDLRAQVRSAATKALLRSLGKSALIGLSTFAIVLIIWVAVLTFSGVSPYVAKGPIDVWNFLFTDEDAVANRAEIGANLAVTMRHSVIGFAAGLAVAIIGAILFRLNRGIESALMPGALLLRSVPLIALAPVIILIVGLGTDASVAVIGGIVVLFPALVTIAFGLNSASAQMLDVVSVYGGSTLTAIRKVALPGALPSLFAAIRVSVPGAITGALLAEYLSTGDGIGRAAATYGTQAKFPDLWASVVVVTFISLIIYTVVQLIETIALTRMGMNPDRKA